MIKMNLGAQCFVIDAVSKITQTEKAKFTRVSLRNNHKVAAPLQPLFRKVSSRNVAFRGNLLKPTTSVSSNRTIFFLTFPLFFVSFFSRGRVENMLRKQLKILVIKVNLQTNTLEHLLECQKVYKQQLNSIQMII